MGPVIDAMDEESVLEALTDEVVIDGVVYEIYNGDCACVGACANDYTQSTDNG